MNLLSTHEAVPGLARLPAHQAFAVMDAHCALCARGARWIARHDTAKSVRIIPMQSPLGHALLQHYGMDPSDPTSWLFLSAGRAYGGFAAVAELGRVLGGPWRLLGGLEYLPGFVQDGLYNAIARSRYRLWGRADLCAMPDPAVRERLWP